MSLERFSGLPVKRRDDEWEEWIVPLDLKHRLRDMARQNRKVPTHTETILWQALRSRKLDGRKFRRQYALGPFILDFYCPEERLAIEVDGPIHALQEEADRLRQELIEALGIRFVRVTSDGVESALPAVLAAIRQAFSSDI